MNTLDLVNHLHQLGIKLRIKDDELVLWAPRGALTEDLERQISADKENLLALLRLVRDSREEDFRPVRDRDEPSPDPPQIYDRQRADQEKAARQQHIEAQLAGLPKESVAIIGMAGRFPGAVDVETFWENVVEGRESITFFSKEELVRDGVEPALVEDQDYVRARGMLRDPGGFDAGFFAMSPREAEITDPQHRLFLECCWLAMENAGHVPGSRNPVGVYGGVGGSRYLEDHLIPNPQLVFPGETVPGEAGQGAALDRQLLRTDPSYRELVDQCRELAAQTLPHPEGSDATDSPRPSQAQQRVSLFTLEYALAKVLMQWGLEPQAMVGHGLGEYVAATLAGVFSLEDALPALPGLPATSALG